MPKIKVNDISMYYEIQGSGEPIVLIAGFSVDHLTWTEVVNQLKDSYQVITFDNRGAGQTDVTKGPYSIEQMANDVVGLCRALDIKKAHFVGNSMGGYIVQTLAHQHPELVTSALISNSTMNTQCCFHIYVDAQLELLKANVPLRALVHASCAWAFSYQFLNQPGVMEQLIEMTLNNPYPFTIEGYEGQYVALDQFNSSQWAHDIRTPTLVVSGDQDLIFNHDLAKKLADQIPHSQYYCFKNCGHLPMIEYPQLFADILKEFISTGKLKH